MGGVRRLLDVGRWSCVVSDRRSLIVAGQGSHGGGWGGVVLLGLAGARAFVEDEQRRVPCFLYFLM